MYIYIYIKNTFDNKVFLCNKLEYICKIYITFFTIEKPPNLLCVFPIPISFTTIWMICFVFLFVNPIQYCSAYFFQFQYYIFLHNVGNWEYNKCSWTVLFVLSHKAVRLPFYLFVCLAVTIAYRHTQCRVPQ